VNAARGLVASALLVFSVLAFKLCDSTWQSVVWYTIPSWLLLPWIMRAVAEAYVMSMADQDHRQRAFEIEIEITDVAPV